MSEVLNWIARAQAAQARALGYRDAETRYYPEKPIGDEDDHNRGTAKEKEKAGDGKPKRPSS